MEKEGDSLNLPIKASDQTAWKSEFEAMIQRAAKAVPTNTHIQEPVPPLAEQVTKKSLIKRAGRRDFLKTVGLALTSTAAVGYGTRKGMDYAADKLLDIIDASEREVRLLARDVQVLSGAVERKLSDETKKLEESYTKGQFHRFEELGIATPAEISEFEQILRQSKEFEEHYKFTERATEFKDRINRRLVSADDKLEGWQPNTGAGLNDAMKKAREAVGGWFGAGVSPAGAYREKLEALCKIYDTNENNRVAEGKILEKINSYLNKDKAMPTEQRELFELLKQQYAQEGGSGRVREFLKNYHRNDAQSLELLRLKAHIEESEKLYGQIRENKTYIQKLQGYLKEGIALKEELRSKRSAEFAKQREEVETRISKLKGTVDEIITDLKSKGYDIETRQDVANKREWGPYARQALEFMQPGTKWIPYLVGGITAFLTWNWRRKNAKLRSTDAALDDLASKYNALAGRYNYLIKKAYNDRKQE